MKLNELWRAEQRNITDMARRAGNTSKNCYVSMGHASPEEAYKQPFIDGFLTMEDINADDWYIV